MFGYGREHRLTKILLTVLLEVGAHLPEIASGTPYGTERAPLPAKNETERRQHVETEAHPKDGAQTVVGQILIQEQQIVAEVQIVLMGIALRQCTASPEGIDICQAICLWF